MINSWNDIVAEINKRGGRSVWYIALDLSACGGSTTFDPEYTNTNQKNKIVSLVLPNKVTNVANGAGTGLDDAAFYGFDKLRVVSGANVATIGNYAFSFCTSLTTASFPKAKTIGDSAFYNCIHLTTVSFPKTATIGEWAFRFCTALTATSFPKAVVISEYAFDNCTSLTTVSFPKAATIGGWAFHYCDAMTTASFPKAATIGEYAFHHCTSLTTVSFLKAATIGDGAFYYCTSLTTASFPEAVTIGNGAFAFTGTAKALTVTLGNTVPTPGTDMFNNVPDTSDSESGKKNVIIKVSGGDWGSIIGAYTETYPFTDNWGNGFRGGGWNGSTMLDSNKVNSNINLTIETDTP
jgi:hypothetical protein